MFNCYSVGVHLALYGIVSTSSLPIYPHPKIDNEMKEMHKMHIKNPLAKIT